MKMDRKRELERELFHIGLLFLALGGGLWVLYHFWLRDILPQMPCLFDKVLGIYCPGCGGTRATVALVHGRLLQSLWYHPLIPYVAVVAGGFMLTQGLDRIGLTCGKGWKYHDWYMHGAIIIVTGNFLVKNLLRLVWGVTM